MDSLIYRCKINDTPLSMYETSPSSSEYVDNLRLSVETHRSRRFADVNGIDFNVSLKEKKMIIGQMLARLFSKQPMMRLLRKMESLDIDFCSTEVTSINLVIHESRDDLISVLATIDHREGILECFSQLVHILGHVARGDLHHSHAWEVTTRNIVRMLRLTPLTRNLAGSLKQLHLKSNVLDYIFIS